MSHDDNHSPCRACGLSRPAWWNPLFSLPPGHLPEKFSFSGADYQAHPAVPLWAWQNGNAASFPPFQAGAVPYPCTKLPYPHPPVSIEAPLILHGNPDNLQLSIPVLPAFPPYRHGKRNTSGLQCAHAPPRLQGRLHLHSYKCRSPPVNVSVFPAPSSSW